MADVMVTVIGYVGSDPTLKITGNNLAWIQFRVGSTRSWRDADSGKWISGATTWFTVKAWDAKARNIADSVKKGTPVIVTGRLSENPYVLTKEGENGQVTTETRHSLTIENATVAIDLSRGIATYTRVDRDVPPPSDIPERFRAQALGNRHDDDEPPVPEDVNVNEITGELMEEAPPLAA